ncbi:MAG: hypothetical protein K2W85_07025 [Phycisphaerales bacterium]|nr:hypothetical protein [Phycisphaerales bacterium]
MRQSARFMLISAVAAMSVGSLVLAQNQPAGGGGNQPGAGGERPRRQGGGGGGGGGGMMGGMGRVFETSVSKDQMGRYAELLGLDDAQKTAVMDLYDAYKADYEASVKSAQQKLQDLREEARDDPARWADLRDEMQKLRDQRNKAESAFFDDVKTALTPAQAEKWPGIERMRRRESSVGRGMMSGERLDLVRIVEDLKLPPEQAKSLSTTLEQYSVDLDRELVIRNEAYDKAQESFRDMMTGGDPEAIQKIMDQGRAASMKVRDVNKRYVRQVEGQIADEAAKAKFQDAIKRASFPAIYRPTIATRTFDAVEKLPDLSADQKQSIADIKGRLSREAGAINQKLEVAYTAREETITTADIMGRFGRGGGGQGGGGGRGGAGGMFDNEETSKLRDERRGLERAALEKIQALLTEEQKAKLPSAGGDDGEERPRRDRGGEGGGAAGGGGGGGGAENAQPRRRPRQQPAETPAPGRS